MSAASGPALSLESLRVLRAQISLQRLLPRPQRDAQRVRSRIRKHRIKRASHVPGPAAAIDWHDRRMRSDKTNDLPGELVPGAGAFVDEMVNPRPQPRVCDERERRPAQIVGRCRGNDLLAGHLDAFTGARDRHPAIDEVAALGARSRMSVEPTGTDHHRMLWRSGERGAFTRQPANAVHLQRCRAIVFAPRLRALSSKYVIAAEGNQPDTVQR